MSSTLEESSRGTAAPRTRRIPNLLHLLLLLGLTLASLVVAETVFALCSKEAPLQALTNQRTQLLANCLAYLLTLLAAAVVFPLVWHRTFLDGVNWNAAKARWWLIPAGVALGFASQGIGNFLPAPAKMPIEEALKFPGAIWVFAVFGTLLAPLFEEIVFRGFLLPGIAIVVDWMRVTRDTRDPATSLARLDAWRMREDFSPVALVISTVVTSLVFALIHAPQLGGNWSPVALLAVVSSVLCFVRIRTGSVAASALVHGCYNLSIFVSIFVATDGFRHLDKM